MAEYVKREDALDAVLFSLVGTGHQSQAIYAIRDVPTADVVEVKRGEWKECFEDWRKQIVGDECSACGFRHYGTSISNYNYCPNCGARMDGTPKERGGEK